VPFVCRVFYLDPDEKGKRYALEFQRRSGCVIQFSDLWAKCKRYFQEAGLLVTDKSPLPSKPQMKPLDVQVTETQTRETLKCLLQMATSKCCDVKSQAVAALCKMSTEEQHQTLMLEEEGCLEAFIAAAGCPDEDVHRCAISALANLAHNRAGVCKKIAEKNGVQRLCTLSTSNTKEIVRESLRALLSLTQSLGCRILDDGCQRVMETHRNSHDPFTQQAIQYLTKLTV
jgi:Glu-tRNA(Gln) amidotransferase subunit E-like FAD-binding protein